MTEAMTTLPIPSAAQYLYVNPDPQRLACPAGHGIAGRHRHRCLPIPGGRHRPAAEGRQRYGLPVHVWVRSFGLTRKTVVAAGARSVRPARRWRYRYRRLGFPSAGCSCLDNAELAGLERNHGDDRQPRPSPGGVMARSRLADWRCPASCRFAPLVSWTPTPAGTQRRRPVHFVRAPTRSHGLSSATPANTLADANNRMLTRSRVLPHCQPCRTPLPRRRGWRTWRTWRTWQ